MPTHNGNLRSIVDEAISAVENTASVLRKLSAQLGTAEPEADELGDPKDPRNKYLVGGLEKFTERGVEICYRMFDSGKSRYAVKTAMGISFGAANHRYSAWQEVGGAKRVRKKID